MLRDQAHDRVALVPPAETDRTRQEQHESRGRSQTWLWVLAWKPISCRDRAWITSCRPRRSSVRLLKDLGLDPASKQARKMIDCVDRRLRFKWHNNRPFLHGETAPCINGRILGLGSYFKEPDDALAETVELRYEHAGVPHAPGPARCRSCR